MAEVNVSFERSMVTFQSQNTLVGALAPILTDRFGIEFPTSQISAMADTVLHSEEAQPATVLELDVGRFALSMTFKRHEGYVPSFQSPYADLSAEVSALNKQLTDAEDSFPLYRAGMLNVNVRDQASVARVLHDLLANVPLTAEISVPKAMEVTGLTVTDEVYSDGTEGHGQIPVQRRLQIQPEGSLMEYASEMVKRNPDTNAWEGSMGMYHTEGGLSVFVMASQGEEEGTYGVHVYLGSVHNPFIIMYEPMSPDQVTHAAAMLNSLQSALQAVDA